jgi:hypothetical protein
MLRATVVPQLTPIESGQRHLDGGSPSSENRPICGQIKSKSNHQKSASNPGSGISKTPANRDKTAGSADQYRESGDRKS